MIGYLNGKVHSAGLNWIMIETSGGVGYKVYATSEIISKFSVDSKIALTTHLVVREDQLTLYGFLTEAELNFFVQLVSVSGVGPKSALGVLNAGQVTELKSAIGSSDVAIFTTISGIGKKTAERIIVELKSKIDVSDVNIAPGTKDLLTALAGLGYNAHEVKKILPDIPKNVENVEDRIRHALKLLGK